MIADWVTTGVSWGIMIASAAFTLFVIFGCFMGFFSIGAWFLKGGHDEEREKKDMEEFYKDDNRPKRS